jgi:amino acid transporter
VERKSEKAGKEDQVLTDLLLTQAAFSYIGTEIVAIAAGETKIPRLAAYDHMSTLGLVAEPSYTVTRRNLPKAIRNVYVRILIFYIAGVLVIGLLVPSNYPGLGLSSKNAAGSPFVIAIKRSGIKALPSVINACLLSECSSSYPTFPHV